MTGKTGETSCQAHYNGRKVGRADITVNTGRHGWRRVVALTVDAGTRRPPTSRGRHVKAVVDDLRQRSGLPGAHQPGDRLDQRADPPELRRRLPDGRFVNDAIYGELNTDADADERRRHRVQQPGRPPGRHQPAPRIPCVLTYGALFSVLPFGNQTVTGTMTGAQIMELLNQAASLNKGAIQVSGYPVQVLQLPGRPRPDRRDAATSVVVGRLRCLRHRQDRPVLRPARPHEDLQDRDERVPRPGRPGQLLRVQVREEHRVLGRHAQPGQRLGRRRPTPEASPFGGALDGRIARDGNDTSGSIVPVTILHHNDSHGNLDKGTYVGYTQLATLIKQERAYNPDRTLLLSGGDNIQGDAMSYYFKSAPLGYAADGTPLARGPADPAALAAFNAMGYDAMDLGNHEFNFGSEIFKAVLEAGGVPDPRRERERHGRLRPGPTVGVEPYVEKTVGPEGIKVAILGITNHRVPNYELPSNIPGLTFSDPLAKAQELSRRRGPVERRGRRADAHRVHRGPEERRGRQERRHEHGQDGHRASTRSSARTATPTRRRVRRHKYLPTIVERPGRRPVIINQAYRYNNTLGELFLASAPKAGGGYELVSRAGQYLSRRLRPSPRTRRSRRSSTRTSVALEGLQQQGHRPDHRPDRRPQGLHRGDQRRPTCRPTPRSSSSTSMRSTRTSTCRAR